MGALKIKNPETGAWEYAGTPVEAVGMQMDLLWTNPDITVEFAPQDIAVNTSGYDMLIVSFAGYHEIFSSTIGTDLIFSKVGQYKQCIFQNSADVLFRGVGWDSYSTVTVENCMIVETYGNPGSRVIANNYAIPYQIYGIRNTSSSNPVGTGTIESIDHPGCFYRMVNGVQEWLNPPMELGVEYKTTERYMGKPVYVKVRETGTLPTAAGVSARLTLMSGATNVLKVVDVKCTLLSGTGNYAAVLPFYKNNATLQAFLVDVGMNDGKPYTYLETTKDMSAYTGIITWKYTKTTD